MRTICILLLVTAIAACGGGDNTAGNVANTNSPAAVTPAPEKTADTPQTVTVDSPDGVKLVGSFYEAGKPMTPALLLLHQWQSDRHSYDEFAKKMQRAGFNVLAIDGRGLGESTKKADGSTVSAGRMNTDVIAMIDDVGAAFDFLAKNKMVDPKRIGIVGASYGSSLALIYAANKPEVGAVALLSPGLDYFGNMQMKPAMKKYGKRPVYMVAADDDSESAAAIKELPPVEAIPQQIKKTYVTGGHGTALLKSQPGLADELQVFFAEHLQRAAK
jgi:dienelactone hydrolase